MPGLVVQICLCATLGAPVPAALGKTPPLLPRPEGREVRVSDVEALGRAVREAQSGDVIVVEPGVYHLPSPLHLNDADDVSLRGATDDAADVVLMGQGFERVDEGDDILRISRCRRVTVAYLTFEECHSYGIKVEGEHEPEDVHIYACRFRNIGMRAVKGSASATCTVRRGSIRYCDFENTKIPEADWLFEGDYISGIDMMALDGWTIADNTFRNIRGHNGGARAAVFVWVRSRNLVVERNFVMGCDRGIAFGNPSMSTASAPDETHVADSVCRNNVILPGPDAGIELAWVRGVKVHHNTVWREDAGGRGIRCIEPVSDTLIAGNLVRGRLDAVDGVTLVGNLVGELEGVFVDPETGDMRLTGEGLPPMEQTAIEVDEDFLGNRRPPVPSPGALERRVGPT